MNKGSYFLGISAMLVLLLALLTGTALAAENALVHQCRPRPDHLRHRRDAKLYQFCTGTLVLLPKPN